MKKLLIFTILYFSIFLNFCFSYDNLLLKECSYKENGFNTSKPGFKRLEKWIENNRKYFVQTELEDEYFTSGYSKWKKKDLKGALNEWDNIKEDNGTVAFIYSCLNTYGIGVEESRSKRANYNLIALRKNNPIASMQYYFSLESSKNVAEDFSIHACDYSSSWYNSDNCKRHKETIEKSKENIVYSLRAAIRGNVPISHYFAGKLMFNDLHSCKEFTDMPSNLKHNAEFMCRKLAYAMFKKASDLGIYHADNQGALIFFELKKNELLPVYNSSLQDIFYKKKNPLKAWLKLEKKNSISNLPKNDNGMLDFNSAVKYISSASEKGSCHASAILADLYFLGLIDAKNNYQKAFDIYKKNFMRTVFECPSVKKVKAFFHPDIKIAIPVEEYHDSVNSIYHSYFMLFFMQWYGLGVDENKEEAIKILQKINKTNKALDIATVEDIQPIIKFYNALHQLNSNEKDEAAINFSDLAENGNYIAAYYLGKMYFEGGGIAVNYSDSYYWLIYADTKIKSEKMKKEIKKILKKLESKLDKLEITKVQNEIKNFKIRNDPSMINEKKKITFTYFPIDLHTINKISLEKIENLY